MSSSGVQVVRYEYGSPEYARALELRQKILREPLGLDIADEDLAEEARDIHLGAWLDRRLVGCLLLRRLGPDVFQMKQVAVDTDHHGIGIGRALVTASEARARVEGASSIELNARESAVPFYQRLGYELIGEGFGLIGLPHRKMRKRL